MKFLNRSLVIATALFMAACDDDDNNLAQPVEMVPVQVIHASPDAPAVNLIIEGDEVLTNFDYLDGTPQIMLPVGGYSYQVEAVLPTGPAVVVDSTFTLREGNKYTIAAINDVSNLQIKVIEQLDETVGGTTSRILVVHAANNVQALVGGPVDVYVTPPGAPLAGVAPAATFSFDETADLGDVPADDYQIRIGFTDAGSGDIVVAYDSGTVTVPGGDDFVISAVPETSPLSPSPAKLLLLGTASVAEIPDTGTSSGIRVLHNSSDAGLVDVTASGPIDIALDDVDFGDVFPGAGSVAPIPAGSYDVTVSKDGNPAIGPVELPFDAGIENNVIALGTIANGTLNAIVANDIVRPVPLYGQVRVIHASEVAATVDPSVSTVDVFVLADGADAPDVDTDVEPTLTGFAFGDNTGFLPLPEGTYDIYITLSGSRTPAITVPDVPVSNGDTVTAIAVDGPGGLGLQLVVDGATPEI